MYAKQMPDCTVKDPRYTLNIMQNNTANKSISPASLSFVRHIWKQIFDFDSCFAMYNLGHCKTVTNPNQFGLLCLASFILKPMFERVFFFFFSFLSITLN